MAAETSQTLDRGLRVLRTLAATPSGLSITALAAEIGVNRTVVYRLVATLEQHGLARRDPSGRLHVGLGVLALGTADDQPDLLGAVDASRSPVAGLVGMVLVWVGTVVLSIGVVGYGVKLGREASGPD